MATDGKKEAGAGAAADGEGRNNGVTLIVITGHSGAGKSEAIAAFEDGGYFCVNNLPPRMIAGLGELFRHEGSGVERAAVVSDVRGGEYFDDLVQVIDDLAGHTLAAASSLEADVREVEGDKKARAAAVGKLVAERAREAGITTVVFDGPPRR